MVSVANDTIDRVAGLGGADDYISKPFEPRCWRVQKRLRRASTTATEECGGPRVAMGRRVLDLERRLLLDTDGAEERLAPGNTIC